MAKLSPAVVNVATERPVQQTARDPKVPPGFQRSGVDSEARSLGSGFVIDPSGLIVTNNHVIDGASEIFVTLRDGTRRAATVRGRGRSPAVPSPTTRSISLTSSASRP
ncbi:MAG TPA: trypsin-like peptidase domain-containing protein [Dehalococcoidia bacterium]|nr:trypsin-like peptidase domain-containing protein [Dehalococcoidia bacterium]